MLAIQKCRQTFEKRCRQVEGKGNKQGAGRAHDATSPSTACRAHPQWQTTTCATLLLFPDERAMRAQQQRAGEFVVPRLVDAGHWVADHERVSCFVCTRPFGTFRRKHHCRMCGEVVCNSCTLHKETVVDPAAGRTRVRVCMSCLCSKPAASSRRAQPPCSSDLLSPHTASSGYSARQWIQGHLLSPSSVDEGADVLRDRQEWSKVDCYTPRAKDGRHKSSFEDMSSDSDSSSSSSGSGNNKKRRTPSSVQRTSVHSTDGSPKNRTWQHMWPEPPTPLDESDRLRLLHSLRVLNTAPEKEFDTICNLARSRLSCQMAGVSFLDEDTQWFKASAGLLHKSIPRKIAFCAYTVFLGESVVVPDLLQDPRFEKNPLVSGVTGIRFYAAAPIVHRETGHAVGSVFVLDTRPRESCDITVLERLAQAASENLPCLPEELAYLDSHDCNNSAKITTSSRHQDPLESRTIATMRLSEQVDALSALYGLETSPEEACKLSMSTASLSSTPSFSVSATQTSPNSKKAVDLLAADVHALQESTECALEGESPPVEALLLRLLSQNTETQQQLAMQQISISQMLGQHSSQISRLMADLARMEAKMEQAQIK